MLITCYMNIVMQTIVLISDGHFAKITAVSHLTVILVTVLVILKNTIHSSVCGSIVTRFELKFRS